MTGLFKLVSYNTHIYKINHISNKCITLENTFLTINIISALKNLVTYLKITQNFNCYHAGTFYHTLN